jgi:CRISPR-associated protein Cas2
MYVIIVYDIGEERITNVRKFLKRFLNWIQNSVFEGEITESQLVRVQNFLHKKIVIESDFIKIYIMSSNKYLSTYNIGTPKKEPTNIL